MHCPKCNFEVNKKDKYCPYCGHLLKDDEPIEAEVFNETKEEVNNQTFSEDYTKEDIEKNKVLALFSYISFLFIIPLIACPNSKYAKYHINQGIILCITNAICSILVSAFIALPAVYAPLEIVINLLLTGLMIYGIYNAATGKTKPLPIIGKFNIYK